MPGGQISCALKKGLELSRHGLNAALADRPGTGKPEPLIQSKGGLIIGGDIERYPRSAPVDGLRDQMIAELFAQPLATSMGGHNQPTEMPRRDVLSRCQLPKGLKFPMRVQSEGWQKRYFDLLP